MAQRTIHLYLSAPGNDLASERRLFLEVIVPLLRTQVHRLGLQIEDVTPQEDVEIAERLEVLQVHHPLVVFFFSRSDHSEESLTAQLTAKFPVTATFAGMSRQEVELAFAAYLSVQRIYCHLSASALDPEPSVVDKARTLHGLHVGRYAVDLGQRTLEQILPGLARTVVDELYSAIEGQLLADEIPVGSGTAPRDAALPFHEDVQFTVYRPRVAPAHEWSTVLAFAHLGSAPLGSDPHDDPIRQVELRAKVLLGDRADNYASMRQDSSMGLPDEAEITFVLELPGFDIRAARRTFLWVNAVHQEEFSIQPSAALQGTTVRGSLLVYHGAILLADLRLAVRVDAHAPAAAFPAPAVTAGPYRRIFPSYSHLDTTIVEQFEAYVEACGDRYLRDVQTLRSGEIWNARLLEFIDEADVFQLFWSHNSMHSPFVEQEWRHALALSRPNFVRPTYWEHPMPTGPGLPPKELQQLHFHLIRKSSEAGVERREPELPTPQPTYPAPPPSVGNSPPANYPYPQSSDYSRPGRYGAPSYPSPPPQYGQPGGPYGWVKQSSPYRPPTVGRHGSPPGADGHRPVWPWLLIAALVVIMIVVVVLAMS